MSCKCLSTMIKCLVNAFTLLFLQPLTAGHFIQDKTKLTRDGKASSIVLLITLSGSLVALLFLRIGSTENETLEIRANVARCVLILLIVLSLVIYTLLFVCRKHITASNYRNVNSLMLIKIRITFIGLFSASSMFYFALTMAIHIKCEVFSGLGHVLQILYDNCMIIIYIIQFLFIFFSFRTKFISTCTMYFAATVLVLTNASIFIYHSFRFNYYKAVENSTNCTNESSFILSIYDLSKPYIEPTVLENSLLAMLVLRQIFSRGKSSSEETELVPAAEDTFEQEFEFPTRESDENSTEERSDLTASFTRKKMFLVAMVTMLSIFICVPMFIIKWKQLGYNRRNEHDIYIAQSIFYFIAKLIIYSALIKCFHFLRKNSRRYAHLKRVPLRFKHYLILFSTFGTIVYFSLQLISSVLSRGFQLYTLKNVMNIITVYLQTVLILHLKDYKRIYDDRNIFSMSSILLFLAMVNFGLWCFDSFYEVQFVYKNEYTVQFFGINTWLTIRHILFPMIMFYRFNSFLSFLEYSNFRFKCSSIDSKKLEYIDIQ